MKELLNKRYHELVDQLCEAIAADDQNRCAKLGKQAYAILQRLEKEA